MEFKSSVPRATLIGSVIYPFLTLSAISTHDGSSGSVEALLCRELIEGIYTQTIGRVVVGQVVSDNDSTLRSVYASVINGEQVGEGVDEPKFLADQAHRTKVMVKPVFGLVKRTKKQDEVKKIDALRLKKY